MGEITNLNGLVKWGWATRCVPEDLLHSIRLDEEPPRVGDLAVGRILEVNHHSRVEGRDWRRRTLYPGDLVGGAFGNRYAMDQFEAYVEPFQDRYHLVGIGGLLGSVRTKNERLIKPPTLIQPLGYAVDDRGNRVSMLEYGLPEASPGASLRSAPFTILVVGATMNSGKTTAAAYTILGLSRSGACVSAAKVTGSACAKDPGIFVDAGAHRVLDFSDCGWPSTFLASMEDLHAIYLRLRSALMREDPEYIVLEIADGLLQRETDMLLRSATFKRSIDAVIFAATDAHSAESGVRHLRALDYNVIAVSGLISTSALGIDEVCRVTGIPCLSKNSLGDGALRPLLRRSPLPNPRLRRFSQASPGAIRQLLAD